MPEAGGGQRGPTVSSWPYSLAELEIEQPPLPEFIWELPPFLAGPPSQGRKQILASCHRSGLCHCIQAAVGAAGLTTPQDPLWLPVLFQNSSKGSMYGAGGVSALSPP